MSSESSAPDPRAPDAFPGLATALFLGIWCFGGLIPHLADAYIGVRHRDHQGTQWFYWFAGELLAGRQPFDHTDLFFYPWGKPILEHTGANLLDAIAAVPVLALLGPVLGYNIFVFLVMASNAWAFSRLARRVCESPGLVGLGAALFAFNPYALSELREGRPTQAALLLPLLGIEALLDLRERPGARGVLTAALLLALTGYQYWYYGLFLGVIALGIGLSAMRDRNALGRFAAAAVASALLVAPVAIPLATRAGAGEVVGMMDVAAWKLSYARPVTREGEEVGLLVWQPLRAQSGFLLMQSDLDRIIHHARWEPWLLGPLVVLGAKRNRALLLACIPLALLALGPVIAFWQWSIPNVPYVLMVKALGILQRLWWPARAMGIVEPVLALAALAGLDRVLRAAPRARWPIMLVVAGDLAFTLYQNGAAPFPKWSAFVPAGIRCMAQTETGAVIDLPMGQAGEHVWLQTVHHRPMFGGMIEDNLVFIPKEAAEIRLENTWLKALEQGTTRDRGPLTYDNADLEAVLDLGYRWVVWSKDIEVPRVGRKATRQHIEGRLVAMLGRPVYDDSRTAIFDLKGRESPCAANPPPPDGVVTEMRAEWQERVQQAGNQKVEPLLRDAPRVEHRTPRPTNAREAR